MVKKSYFVKDTLNYHIKFKGINESYEVCFTTFDKDWENFFFFFFFLKFFCRTHSHVLFWGHWYPCFGFLVTSPLGFKARVGSALIRIAEANVMYISWDPPLVLHIADLLTDSIVGRWPGSCLAQGYYCVAAVSLEPAINRSWVPRANHSATASWSGLREFNLTSNMSVTLLFKKKKKKFLFWEGGHIHMSCFGATGSPSLDFWWCLIWVSKPEWVLSYSNCRGEWNVHSMRSTSGAYLLPISLQKTKNCKLRISRVQINWVQLSNIDQMDFTFLVTCYHLMLVFTKDAL